MKRTHWFGLVWLTMLLSVSSPVSFSQGKPDVVVFDEDDPIGQGYYDASYGFASGGSTLTLRGPGNDKLIIDTAHYYTGHNSGLLQWKSASGGNWKIFVASIGWASRDVSGYDSVIIFVNGPSAISAANLPKVGLESSTNVSTPTVSMGSYLLSGVDGDSTTWQRVSIPLNAFEPYGGFSLSNFKDVNFSQGIADNTLNTLWIDNIRIVAKVSVVDTTIPRAPQNLITLAGDKSAMLYWDPNTESNLLGYNIYRSFALAGTYTKINPSPVTSPSFADLNVSNGQTYYYFVRAVNTNQNESPNSDTVAVTPKGFVSDDEFLELLQRTAFNYFWYEANPSNGLIRDRSEPTSAASIAAVGFGLTAIGIAIDHGWITRPAGADRTLTTLTTFWRQPQGSEATGKIGYKGWFYHFLNMKTAVREGSSELSPIDTGLLLAGILYARQYFDGSDPTEVQIRALADSIFNRVDWTWMTNGDSSLTMGWYPESGFLGARWIGYNEAMILNLLGIGANINPLPPSVWNSWLSGYDWATYYGYSFVPFPPLFGHQYSHCWVDFRGIADSYMKDKGITYFENSRRATLAQREYCIANPGGYPGYGSNIWGLTACDGPGSTGFYGYIARGAPPPQNDDGTIAPTAPGGSIPFTPEYSIPALRHMYDVYREYIWTAYGFRDAFNLKANWWGPDVIGIDQGPIIIMAENYRTGHVWQVFMRNTEIQRGLQRAGFSPVTEVAQSYNGLPEHYTLEQNYPNPFSARGRSAYGGNPSTEIRYSIPEDGWVTIRVFDLLGRDVMTVVNEYKKAGNHSVRLDGSSLPSGVYFYRMSVNGTTLVRKMMVLR